MARRLLTDKIDENRSLRLCVNIGFWLCDVDVDDSSFNGWQTECPSIEVDAR